MTNMIIQRTMKCETSRQSPFTGMLKGQTVNSSSPNSDQQQISPNNIHTLSRGKVMRINKVIIIEKIP